MCAQFGKNNALYLSFIVLVVKRIKAMAVGTVQRSRFNERKQCLYTCV